MCVFHIAHYVTFIDWMNKWLKDPMNFRVSIVVINYLELHSKYPIHIYLIKSNTLTCHLMPWDQ